MGVAAPAAWITTIAFGSHHHTFMPISSCLRLPAHAHMPTCSMSMQSTQSLLHCRFCLTIIPSHQRVGNVNRTFIGQTAEALTSRIRMRGDTGVIVALYRQHARDYNT